MFSIMDHSLTMNFVFRYLLNVCVTTKNNYQVTILKLMVENNMAHRLSKIVNIIFLRNY